MERRGTQIDKLGQILDKSLKRLDPSGRLDEYGVWPIWNDAVGPTIARNAQPEKIRHGTLFIKVSSPVWMQQLQYMKEAITEKLNQSLGREVVKNLFFVVGKLDTETSTADASGPQSPAPSPTNAKLDEEILSSVKDPEIRRALRRLFAARSRKGKNRKT